MESNFKLRKRFVVAGLTLLVTADLMLFAYSWRLSSAPRTPKQELITENQQLQVLRADIRRAEEIKQKMPTTQKDCDKFEHSLRQANAGYSAVTAEIGAIAAKSSLRLDGLTFKQKQISNRNLEVVDLEAAVNGDYSSVVRFVNGLQRSESIYEIDSLTVAGNSNSQNRSSNGSVRVLLHMKTYFRTV
jgi:Tfp pilus assembly protein PilO